MVASADEVVRAIGRGQLPDAAADCGPDSLAVVALVASGEFADPEARSAELVDYGLAVATMEALVERPPTARDVLFLLEHPPVVTLGRRGGLANLLATQFVGADGQPVQIAVHQVARGGDVTMHAPGQLVAYPVVQLAQLAPPIGRGSMGDLPAYVRALEEEIIACCLHFGVHARQRSGFTGVWVADHLKIASIGVGVRRGWSFHGLALNVDPNLALFGLMRPCGLAGVRLTSIAEQLHERGIQVPIVAEVALDLAARLTARLRRLPAPLGTVPE